MPGFVEGELSAHQSILEKTIGESSQLVEDLAMLIVQCFSAGNKLLLCGNGGSAADAQHVAAEFMNRFRIDRAPLPALALTTDSSVLTSIGNDFSFEHVFSKQVEALARPGDILVGISTSGASANVLRAIDTARAHGLITIGFTGERGKERFGESCDYCLAVPSGDTARIQECHEFVWHVICGLVEQAMFPRERQQIRLEP